MSGFLASVRDGRTPRYPRRARRTAVAVFVALSGLVGWSFADPFVWPSAWIDDPLPETASGVFVSVSDGPPASFNPISTQSRNNVLSFADNAPLLLRDPRDRRWVPHAAETYSVSADGRTIRFRLRPELRWSDGQPIRANDFVFRLEAESDPDTLSYAYDWWVHGDGERITVRAVDPLTLEFSLPRPDRVALERVAGLSPAPDHVLGEIYRSVGGRAFTRVWSAGTDPADTVWAGAYIPVGDQNSERYRLQRNPYYGAWNVDENGRPLPYLEGIVMPYSSDPAAWDGLFKTGQVDVLPTMRPTQIADIGRLINDGTLDARLYPNTGFPENQTNLFFNWNRSSDPRRQALLRDVRFRQAVSHLLDREGFARVAFGSRGVAQWSTVYLAYPEWIPDELATFPFDPDRAAELFDDLGYTEFGPDGIRMNAAGERLQVDLVSDVRNEDRTRPLRVLVDEAEKAGLAIDLRLVDFGMQIDMLQHQPATDRPFDMMVIGTYGDTRGWPFRDEEFGCDGYEHLWNYSGTCIFEAEAEMERLAARGRATLDDAEALEIAHEIQHLQMELLPVLYLPIAPVGVAFHGRVGGLWPAELMSFSEGFGFNQTMFIREGYE